MSTENTDATASENATADTPPLAPGRVEVEDGIAWVFLDDKSKPVNTLNSGYFAWFDEQLNELERQPLRGLVFISEKPGIFVAGADIEELEHLHEPAAVKAMIMRGHELVGRFAEMPFPVVAAIDGACLGGGLELALACDYRVCTTANHTKLGLPEVMLGIYPGLGGTQRLPRLIGVQEALDLILTGKSINARKAKKLGLVHDTCHPTVLRQAAIGLVGRGKPKSTSTRSKKASFLSRATDLLARTPGAKNLIFEKAREMVIKKTGGHMPAPLKALEVVEQGLTMDLDEALELEADGFAKIVVTDVAKGMISIFFTKNEVDARAKQTAKKARKVDTIGVLGAGFMGAGVAQVLAHKGYEVMLKDRDHEGLARGLKQSNDLFASMVKRRKYRPVELKEAMSRLVPATDYRGFGRVPFVIEAVFEDLAIKEKVIAEVEAAGPDDLIFASNTSTIPITALAKASKRPENVIGMHFFSPVHKMPLLEIIRHPGTSEETLATTVKIGQRMGKTIIVVEDGPGFFTSRVLGPFVNEALFLLQEGASIEQIDKAVSGWGWPVGPIALLDEVGLDVAQKAGKVMLEHAGDRMDSSPIFDKMINSGRKGRKGGRGFYDYSKKPKRIDESVYQLIDWQPKEIDDQEIIERTWMQMLNETARCIEDGVISNPNDIDIGVIFGFGFPPFRGGMLREADRIGIDYVVSRLEGYAERHGQRLAPAQLLVDMAKNGEKFHKD